MPIVSEVRGDLIKRAKKGSYWGIAQGCNIFCVMGAGIAPQIAKAWPEAEEADNFTIRGDVSKLGYFTHFHTQEQGLPLTIFNCYTQAGTGGLSRGEPDINYRAIRDCFTKLNAVYLGRNRNKAFDDNRMFGIPQIGAGLAGGHWNAIHTIIDMSTPDMDIELVIFDG